MRALGQAQHRLPVAGHRDRALGDVAARPDLAQRGELAQLAGRPALPGEDLEPLVVARRARRIELDGDVRRARRRRASGRWRRACRRRRCAGAGRRAPRGRRRPPARRRAARSRAGRRARSRASRGSGSCARRGRCRPAPAARARTTAGTSIDAGHGWGIQTWLQPHSAARPTRPDAQPAEQREAQRRARRGERRALDDRRPRRCRAGSAASCSPATWPTNSASAMRMTKNIPSAWKAPQRPEDRARAHERDARRRRRSAPAGRAAGTAGRRSRTPPGRSTGR